MILSPIDEIKARLDIVEVIGDYIKLQRAGANFRALCPFHSEKKPSFFVSPSRQIWHCFGCGKGGDVFGFVKEIEGVEFGDALRILAQKAGIELKRASPELRTERKRLYEICELACRFFEKQLWESSTGKEAKNYLLSRGITEDSIKKWRLGYSPHAWQSLSDFLISRGYQLEEIKKAGLALTSEQGSFYDRFRGRIIFPIFDLNSQVVGFGARVFKFDDPAKYINTPNTLLYDKSKILYGLDKARVEIRKKDSCILVEGYIDAIMVSQAGSENVVATSGTALSPFQLRVLKRYSENLIIAFDMDIAGSSATKRGIDLAQSQDFNIKVIIMPENSDPADILSRQDLKKWQELLENAKSILEFYFENTFSQIDPKTPEGKKEAAKILLPVIKRIPNKIQQSYWIQRLAKILEVPEEVISVELKKTVDVFRGPDWEETRDDFVSKIPKSRKELLEEKVVSLILKAPQNLNIIEDKYFPYFSPKIQTILTELKNCSNLEKIDLGELNYLFLSGEFEDDNIDLEEELKICLKEIKSIEIKNKLDEISIKIKKAEEEKNLEKIHSLIKEFNKLAQELI